MSMRWFAVAVAAIPTFLAMMNIPRIAWRDKQPLPAPVAGGYPAGFGNTLLYAGGTNWKDGVKHWLREVSLYDVKADEWRSGPPLPYALAYGTQVGLNDGIEIYGGTDGKSVYRNSWRFTASSSSWERLGKLEFDTLLSRAVTTGDSVYLFGGCSDVVDLTTCSDAVYVHGHGSWRKVSAIPYGPVAQAAVAAAGNHVYVFGGCSMRFAGKQLNHDEAYTLDLRSMKWRRIRSLPKPNSGPTALTLNDQYILVAGGYTASSEEAAGKPADFGFSSDAMLYDIQNDDYRPVRALPVALSGVDLVKIGNTVFGLGGEDRMRGRTARVFAGTVEW